MAKIKIIFRPPGKHFTSPPTSLPMMGSQAYYAQLLQSSTDAHCLIKGKAIHAQILKSSFTPCLFLQNNLLNLYCKCGNMVLARRVFDGMPNRDIVAWNSLITGFFQMGSCKKAMDMFMEARNADVFLDRFSYASALSVCSRTGEVKMGKVVHGLVVVSGLHRRVFLVNSLIDMYAKCGEIEAARHVFDSSDELDDVSWNSLISACSRAGLVDESLRIFAQMHRVGVEMDTFAIGSVIKSCSSLSNSRGFEKLVHASVIKIGLDFEVFVASAMLDMYAKNGFLDEAVKIFKLTPEPNIVVFNAMIAGYCRFETRTYNESTIEALGLFSEMQRRGIRLSKFTFSSVLRACNLSESFEFGKQIQALVFKNNFHADEFIGSALIDLYSNSGLVEDGFRCFHSVPKQDIVTWTSMISGCIENEYFERALSLFHELLSIGRKPDQFTISSVMSACANMAIARSGEQIQNYAMKAGLDRFTICHNSQIFMYSRSGNVDAANRTFKEVVSRDVVSWTAMISSHAQHGCARDALMVFKEMEESNVAPNDITFLAVLTACSHAGLVDEGFRYYERMKREYSLTPNVKHCACMVDLLGRAGKLADAEDFIHDSGFHDDPVVWRALLGSCRVHKDLERGARIAERVMELEPGASASYVILYNMYLDAENKSSALKTRDLMKERGVKKEPGLSWIEIGAGVHSFVVGDESHPQTNAIYAKLGDMMSKIEKKELGGTTSFHNGSLVNCHSEKLAVALGMIFLPESAPIRVMKNIRVCGDCHTKMKLFSQSERREIVLRDPVRFHRFRDGLCSCGDYW